MHLHRLVPETAPQSAVLLTWPHVHSAWADSLEAVTAVYLEIARAVATRENLLVVCYDPDHAGEIRQACSRAGVPLDAVRFFTARTNDTWIRDYGPLAVSDGNGLRLLDFAFDGWSGNTLPRWITKSHGIWNPGACSRHPAGASLLCSRVAASTPTARAVC